MSTSLFDSAAWYRLSNDLTGPNQTLSLGITGWPAPTPLISPAGAYSSENWQLFFDDGVYFIRNYDYHDAFELGVSEGDRSLPVMLSTSGALGMQWTLSQWNSSSDEGTWKLTNGLLGSGGLVLGVADSGEADGSTVLAMNADPTGAHWTFDINVSAGRITDESILSAFPSVETPAPTSTSQSSSTQLTPTQSPTTTAFIANTSSGSVHNSSSTSTPTAHNSVPSGAAAGAAITSIPVMIATMLLIFLSSF